MPQTIVNFLTQATVGGTLTTSARVFDYEIGSVEQLIYQHLMEDLQTAINGSNASKIKQILMELNKWSQIKVSTGTEVVTDSTKTISDLRTTPLTKLTEVTTMNRYMAEDVDKIIRTLRSAGWDPIITASSDNSAGAALTLIHDNPSIYPVLQWITEGINAAGGAVLDTGVRDIEGTSLQQMLMVDYVSHGNDLLFNEMSTLSTAISNNQDALSYLNSLQDLMNQKDPKTFLLALNQLSGISSTNTAAYTAFEKASFDQELGTTAKFTADQIGSYLTLINSPTYTTDITTLKTDAAALSLKLDSSTTITDIQALAAAAYQWPSSVPDPTGKLMAFQTGYANFLTQLQAVQTATAAWKALSMNSEIYTSSLGAISSTLQTLKTAVTDLDATYSALNTSVNNINTAIGSSDPSYLATLNAAWNQIKTTDLSSAAPSAKWGTQLTDFQTKLTNIATHAGVMLTHLFTTDQAQNFEDKAHDVADWVHTEYPWWWATQRFAIRDTIWADWATVQTRNTEYKNAINTYRVTLVRAQASDPSLGIQDLENSVWSLGYYSLKYREALDQFKTDASSLYSELDQTTDPASYERKLINFINAMPSTNEMSYANDWSKVIYDGHIAGNTADLNFLTGCIYEAGPNGPIYQSTAQKAITVVGTTLIGTLSPASTTSLYGLIAEWPTGLADNAEARVQFLSSYAAFQGQIATFKDKKNTYVNLVNSSTEPNSTLIAAAKALVTAIENLDTTFSILKSSSTTLISESTSNTTYNSQLSAASTKFFTTDMGGKNPLQWTTTLASVKSILSKLTETAAGSASGAFVNLDDATKTFNANKERIITNLTYLLEQLGITSGATSLTSSLETLKKDFTDVADIAVWVQDYATAQQGSYQTHLNNAIVASQSLNDAKREELRQVMFVFEEFYKSSTSMLSRLTQLIEKMASAINR